MSCLSRLRASWSRRLIVPTGTPDGSHFGNRVFADVVEHDGFALHAAQPSDGLHHAFLQTLSLEIDNPVPPLSEVDAAVNRDRPEPGAQPLRILQILKAVERFDESSLCQILGVVEVAQTGQCDAEDGILEADNDGPEELGSTVEGLGNERCIVRLPGRRPAFMRYVNFGGQKVRSVWHFLITSPDLGTCLSCTVNLERRKVRCSARTC